MRNENTKQRSNMKFTKNDMNKIATSMAECTFDENGYIVDEETPKTVNRDKEKHDNATWTKFSLSGDGIIVLKQFNGDTLDTIALTKEEVNNICDMVNEEVA